MADNLDGLAAAAGAGNSSLASAFEELLRSNIANRPTPQERQGALSQYTTALKTPADDRKDWEVMLSGRLTAENPFDPRQAGVAAMKYKMVWDQTQREAAKKANEVAAKAQYDDILKRQEGAMGGAGVMTQLAHSALNPIMNIGGVGVNRQTGRVIVPKDYIPVHSKVREDAYKAAIEQKMPNPEQYADQQADAYIMRLLQNASVSGPGFAQRPDQAPLPAQGPASAQVSPPDSLSYNVAQTPEGAEVIDKTQAGFDFKNLRNLSPAERDKLSGVIEAYKKSPTPATQARIESVMAELNDKRGLEVVPRAAPSSVQYRDIPKSKMQESQAEVVGKDLAKEGALLNDAMHASNKMITQLDLLDKLYSVPNMPEGELGSLLQQVRSSLKTLGIDVGKEVGAADLARSVASNFALHLRTGEGQNLLPGAMSNYEDKLLQQMAPVLSLTNEGRLALIQAMREMAKTNARFGHEFNIMTDERGIVSPEWRKRKERVMKEEMARLAEVNSELMNRFQGAK